MLQEGFPPQATGVHRRCAEGIPEGVSNDSYLGWETRLSPAGRLRQQYCLLCRRLAFTEGVPFGDSRGVSHRHTRRVSRATNN
ncbi:MAG: hypothetical protein KME57_20750 [Scytonema hyalinum WJT4-NPBG1]|nr:hypothetical protein [Scytonema hyalinum WJT4-NPBG1]